MKVTLGRSLSTISLVVVLAGCGKAPEKKVGTAPTPPPEKGNLQTAVEGFTGKIAVDAGQRAKDQIKAASAARNQNMEELER